MPRLQFGYTWWGKKWLDALIATDYSNRLPRGARYARNGSVRTMSIMGNKIQAAVQGSLLSPYKITITLPAFSDQQQKKILSLITKHPYILSQLSQKKLPQELYEVFTKKGLHLFPKEWSDLHADCSCPDWADCCKHIAAVIYLIANKIDMDPFMLFSLHRFDVLKALETLDVRKEDVKVKMRRTEDILQHSPKATEMESTQPPSKDGWKTIDFSGIPRIGSDIVSLLPETQIFCREADIKQCYTKLYDRLMSAMDWHEQSSDNGPQVLAYRVTKLGIDASLRITQMTISDGACHIDTESAVLKGPEDIPGFLRSIPFSELAFLDQGIRVLWLAFHFSSILCCKGAIVPEILEQNSSTYRVRYIPALLQPDVRGVFEQIAASIPDDFLGVTSGKKGRKQSLSREEALLTLLSHFLQRKMLHAAADLDSANNPVFHTLFIGEDLVLSEEVSRDIPELICLYFSRFFLSRQYDVPTLIVEEQKKNTGFSLTLGIREHRHDVFPIPMCDVLTQKKHVKRKHDVLKVFGLLAEYYPAISSMLTSEDATLELSDEHCVDLLMHVLPILRLLGISTMLPRSLEEILVPKPSLSIQKKSADKIKSYLSLHQMLSFDWRIAIGEHTITETELQEMLERGRTLLRFKESYVYLEPGNIEKMLQELRRIPSLPSAASVLHLLLTKQYNGAPISIDKNLLREMEELFKEKPITVPSALQATLRQYQERGFAWLYRNMKLGFGSLLADDMGLGKTLQVIALLLKMKEEHMLQPGAALVVVPTTLLTNWQKEIEKFAPTLRTAVYHGADRHLPKTTCDVLLTSYGLIRRDAEQFQRKKWAVTVLDEAQNVKNRHTAQSKAVKNLQSDFRIAMTGTPVENSLMEYWNIVDSIHPGYLGEAKTFKTIFASPIEAQRDTKALSTFHAITKPLIIRRLKTDTSIITDLPKKIENNAFTTLSKEQVSLYQATVDSIMGDIEGSEGIERKGLVFKLMTALKQICNHPAHYRKLQEFGWEESGKMTYLLPLLQTVRENHEKVLIFTQYTEMGSILRQLIHQHFQAEPLFFHGALSRSKRTKMIDAFQEEPHHNIMILSLKAGGVGLNLTAASHVIHYDLWWNPAVETQATDRAYRIGQKRNVLVHRFITHGTFEEKIDAMIKRKKHLANLTVASGEKWLGELSNKELRDIVTLAR